MNGRLLIVSLAMVLIALGISLGPVLPAQEDTVRKLQLDVTKLTRANKNEEAIALCQQILRDYPESERVHIILGAMAHTYVALGDYEKAFQTFKQSAAKENIQRIARGKHPREEEYIEPDAYLRIAGRCARLGRHEEAIQFCQKVVDKHPSHASTALHKMADEYGVLGDFDKSLELCIEAMKARRPESEVNEADIRVAHASFARILRRGKQFDRAIAEFQKLLDSVPPDGRGGDYFRQEIEETKKEQARYKKLKAERQGLRDLEAQREGIKPQIEEMIVSWEKAMETGDGALLDRVYSEECRLRKFDDDKDGRNNFDELKEYIRAHRIEISNRNLRFEKMRVSMGGIGSLDNKTKIIRVARATVPIEFDIRIDGEGQPRTWKYAVGLVKTNGTWKIYHFPMGLDYSD